MKKSKKFQFRTLGPEQNITGYKYLEYVTPKWSKMVIARISFIPILYVMPV